MRTRRVLRLSYAEALERADRLPGSLTSPAPTKRLTGVTRSVLADIRTAPVSRAEINPGIVQRLEDQHFVEGVDRLRITTAGMKALDESAEPEQDEADPAGAGHAR